MSPAVVTDTHSSTTVSYTRLLLLQPCAAIQITRSHCDGIRSRSLLKRGSTVRALRVSTESEPHTETIQVSQAGNIERGREARGAKQGWTASNLSSRTGQSAAERVISRTWSTVWNVKIGLLSCFVAGLTRALSAPIAGVYDCNSADLFSLCSRASSPRGNTALISSRKRERRFAQRQGTRPIRREPPAQPDALGSSFVSVEDLPRACKVLERALPKTGKQIAACPSPTWLRVPRASGRSRRWRKSSLRPKAAGSGRLRNIVSS
ncbi:hypothetical protein F441_03222 [Phytophthora nicotianae CJ01A1]|uniref:Uncharacterized protein n=1 Tax=Phytophthora nicotianae CJ01A1 TaxID=1317063 RepID=W2XMM5_PHYNI|nr:hypothetical protein F441_03222 [Phytophthora nicotianae CJ01A1]